MGSVSMKTFIPRLCSLVLALCLVAPLAVQAQILKNGDAAPDFALDALDGTSYSMSDFRGKVVLIHFFGFN